MNFFKIFLLIALSITILSWIFLFGFWFWLGYEFIECEIKEIENTSEYDFIIVGAGTAGCVLANKLSSDPDISVLLIEAGRTFGPLSIIPLATTLMQGSNVDWTFKTVSQKFSSKGLFDQQQFIPRGKGLGGTHQLNYMLHFDGDEHDFKIWEEKAGKLWSYDAIKKYLTDDQTACTGKNNDETISTPQDTCSYDDIKNYHKTKEISSFQELSDSKLTNFFLDAENELRLENENIEMNIAKYNIKNGKRFSVYHKYLKPIFKRTNLHVLTNTYVQKIVFQDKRAVAVVISSYQNNIDRKIIKARKEIILSAGAIQSPQLLKLSGIGPADELNLHSINLIYDSPMVGENLFDHTNMPIYVSIKKPESVTKDKILTVKEWYKYFTEGKGVLSSTAVVGMGKSLKENVGVILWGMGTVDEKALRQIANFKPKIFRLLFPFYHNTSNEGFLLLNTCHHPKSRGSITLNDRNIFTAPNINPKYFSNKNDINCMRQAIRFSVEIIETISFLKLGAKINWPKFKSCSKYGPVSNDFLTNDPSDEYLECILRIGALTAHHPGGTCAMGNGSLSVVDEYLGVRGVKGLRVVDGSVFPHPISGTPNSIIIAVASYAAELIKNEYLV